METAFDTENSFIKTLQYVLINLSQNMKNRIKQLSISFFKKVIVKDEIKSTLVDSLHNPFMSKNDMIGELTNFNEQLLPYLELGTTLQAGTVANRTDVIFITGRFRSGSTLLWNIFRSIPEITAYYEPFNENQWFNPYIKKKTVDKTHKMVDDYDKEYQGLEMLSELYREDWIRKNLYMEDFFYEPVMQQFITLLIEHTSDRPVLQFNRIDLRLPWIRHNFPNARIIHIYRHPRDQWCSSLRDISSFASNGSMEQFALHDNFYLRTWARVLKYHFPFLDECSVTHPYELFYFIWKLSFIFGKAYADFAVCFENLIEHPSEVLTPLFEKLNIDVNNVSRAEKLIVTPRMDKWKEYANDKWFSQIESYCETVLYNFLLSQKKA